MWAFPFGLRVRGSAKSASWRLFRSFHSFLPRQSGITRDVHGKMDALVIIAGY